MYNITGYYDITYALFQHVTLPISSSCDTVKCTADFCWCNSLKLYLMNSSKPLLRLASCGSCMVDRIKV